MNNAELQGALIAQSYLIELLMLQLLHNQANPRHVLDTIRFQMAAQIRDDAAKLIRPFALPQSSDIADVVAATERKMTFALDALQAQIESPPPRKHHA